MQMRSSLRSVAPCLLALALLSGSAARAWAQAGQIAGTITDKGGQTVASARVVVLGTRLEALSAADGAFLIPGVHAGTYNVAVSRLGYRDEISHGVTVSAGGTARVNFELTASAIELAGLVVSATRKPERVTDAPATVSKIGPEALANSVGNSFNGAIKDVKGLQFIQVGMTTAAVNARGFNSSFNNRMLMMEDGRIAVLPENGLPLGQMTALPKIDLSGVEVLVGPGAALYGPDASNGVITLGTKSPREYSGTAFELSGGSKDYVDAQGRYAAMHGNFGYKLAGEYNYSKDWSNRLNYGTASAPLWEIGADFQNRVARGDGGLYWYGLPLDSKLEVTGGVSRTDGVGQTNVGRNQLAGWLYDFAQARWSNAHWYANLYRTESKAGNSYAINRYTQYKVDPTMAGLSDDSIKSAAGWPSHGQLYAAELQNNFRLTPIRTSLIWGGQFRRDYDSSERRWLTDRLTGKTISLNQKGIYAQTETDLLPQLQLVLAGRYDKHDRYDGQFSPKVGLVFKPASDQALRVTYNQAFKSPTTLQTDFYIPEFVRFVGVYGNANGFTVKNAAGAAVATYQGLQPEKNRTWELGYKGVLAKRAYLDVTGYRAHYENFMSPLITIANPFAGASATFAYDARGNLIQANGLPEIVLTYVNMGQATLSGVDAGLRYAASDRIELNGTLTLVHADTIEPGVYGTQSNKLETTALNSTPVQWTLGASFLNPLPDFSWNLGVRHSTGYEFRSGINLGRIPTFNTLDVGASYKLPVEGARLNLSIDNLYTCRADYGGQLDAVPLTAVKTGTKCGFGERHQEMVNMPYIGTMVFLGLQYNH